MTTPTGPAESDVLPVARTDAEAQLYLDLNPCPACGSPQTPWRSGLALSGADMVIRYSGHCDGCGQARRYDFTQPDRVTAPRSWPTFGDAAPSQLIDAGQWLAIAMRNGGAPSTGDPAADDRHRRLARAAVGEVVKFIPAEDDSVPDSAFWSTAGRRFRQQWPGRFSRERLAVIAETFEHAD